MVTVCPQYTSVSIILLCGLFVLSFNIVNFVEVILKWQMTMMLEKKKFAISEKENIFQEEERNPTVLN
jgi:hypothetical protein